MADKVIDLGSVTIKDTDPKSILIYPDGDGNTLLDYTYDRLDGDGAVYDTLHHVVAVPAGAIKIADLWAGAHAVTNAVEGLD